MSKLKILESNLTFSQALVALKEKKFIKVPEWDGYWFLQGGKIKVMTYDGQITDTPWLEGTVLREDWQIVEQDMQDLIEQLRNTPIQFFNNP